MAAKLDRSDLRLIAEIDLAPQDVGVGQKILSGYLIRNWSVGTELVP